MFSVNLRLPVYSVACPHCGAYALAPCRTKHRQQSPPGAVLTEPHIERKAALALTPQAQRVQGYLPCMHPSGCLNSEHTAGGLDDEQLCPIHGRKQLKGDE